MKVILDTNVIVSALLTGTGAPAIVWRSVHQRQCTLVTSAEILAEYRDVLSRTKFKFGPDVQRSTLALVHRWAVRVSPEPWTGVMIDDTDRRFVEAALVGRVDYIVTGNARHFPKNLPVRVCTPRECVELLRAKK